MLRYHIVHSDGSSDGRATKELDVDFMSMPTPDSSLIQFWRQQAGEYMMVFAINPANIMTLELLEGTPVNNGRYTFDEAQGPPIVSS